MPRQSKQREEIDGVLAKSKIEVVITEILTRSLKTLHFQVVFDIFNLKTKLKNKSSETFVIIGMVL